MANLAGASALEGSRVIVVEIQRPKVNQRKAAEIAGVTTRTIRNWMRLGWIEFVRTPAGDPRIFVDTLFRRDQHGDAA